MEYRRLGKTGFDVSEVSLGAWQVGGRRFGGGYFTHGEGFHFLTSLIGQLAALILFYIFHSSNTE